MLGPVNVDIANDQIGDRNDGGDSVGMRLDIDRQTTTFVSHHQGYSCLDDGIKHSIEICPQRGRGNWRIPSILAGITHTYGLFLHTYVLYTAVSAGAGEADAGWEHRYVDVLVIGAGAREHALIAALDADPGVEAVHVAPGNAGMVNSATVHPLHTVDGPSVTSLAQELGVHLVVIGPEAPLVAGVADDLRAAGIACFGPSAQAARLEASKSFAKQVMNSAGVPTARATTITDLDTASVVLDEFGAPHVVKDDGLAAGKGVVVTDSKDEALAHVAACLDKPNGRVVIEEYLDGPEVSLFCVTDGVSVVPLQPAQDFKRVGDGDTGPNTGGMGAYTPLPWAPAGLVDWVVANIAEPTIKQMSAQDAPFAGLLYIGLALTSQGVKVIEFNARFGDPETQSVLAVLKTPLSVVLNAAATGTLATLPPLQWRDEAAVTVVVAAENYPGDPIKGDPIAGIETAEADPHVQVLHAGTGEDGAEFVTAGGRVLSVVGRGRDLNEARERAYAAVDEISIRGSHYRTDIAQAAAEGAITVPAASKELS